MRRSTGSPASSKAVRGARPRDDRARIATALLVAFAAAACSEDTTPSVDVGFTGNPTLEIVRPADGRCIPIGPTGDTSIPIQIETSELNLRPPGICTDLGYAQCGHLVLTVNGVANNRGAGLVIDLELAKLADRFGDLSYEVTVATEQLAPAGTKADDVAGDGYLALKDHAGKALRVARRITTVAAVEECPAGTGGGGGSGGGGGAGGGTGGDAGGGTGGSGGSGGSGGATGGSGGATGGAGGSGGN